LRGIEGAVLERVENVEPADPERHRQRAHGEQPPRLAPPPRDREIPRGHGDPVRQTEPEMRPVREPLGVAVGRDEHERGRREREAQRIQRPGRPEKQRRRERDGAPGLAQRETPRGQLARAGARVLRVELAVGDAVEPERHEPRAGEGEHHQSQRPPRDRRLARRDEQAQQRERQREHCMRELDKVDVADEQALAAEGLPLTEHTSSAPPRPPPPPRAPRAQSPAPSPFPPPAAWWPPPSRIPSALRALSPLPSLRGSPRSPPS